MEIYRSTEKGKKFQKKNLAIQATPFPKAANSEIIPIKKVALLFFLCLSSVINSFAGIFSGGDGTETNPYLISSQTDMSDLASAVNSENDYSGKYFLLTRDLTGNDETITTVIGNSASRPFCGIFDGGGHKIAVEINSFDYAGVFGYIQNATVKNLGVSGSISSSPYYYISYSGGICGCAYGGTISNCYNTGSVSSYSPDSYSGGICGYSNYSSISNCYNTGSVSSYSDTDNDSNASSISHSGGICGYGEDSSISNCYNTNSVSSYSYTSASSYSSSYSYSGGICGYGNYSTTSTCYNTGSVSSSSSSAASSPISYSGGICGHGFYNGSIFNCYNTGNVSSHSDSSNVSPGSYSGGICGESIYSGSISNSYNTGSVSSSSSLSLYYSSYSYSGGICGHGFYNGSIFNCYNTGNISSGSDSPSDSGSGGICGYLSGYTISNCIAANTAITGNIAGRIVGYIEEGSIENCYALASMEVNENTITGSSASSGKDGESQQLSSFQSQSWIEETLQWDFNTIWKMSEIHSVFNGLPILKNVGITTAIDHPHLSQGGNIKKLYPVSNGISIETATAMPVAIYTVSGQKIYQAVISGNKEIHLDKGIYVVCAHKESKKIIVQ